MDRRDFIATTIAATAIGASKAMGHSNVMQATGQAKEPEEGIDRDRASYVMRQMGLDALMISDPVNMLWATGVTPVTEKMGILGLNAVLVPRDSSAPIALITPQFSYYYNMAEPGLLAGVAPVLYTAPTMINDGSDTTGASDPIFFEPHGDAALTEREANRRAATFATGPFANGLNDALRRELRALGSDAITVGADSAEAARLLPDTPQLTKRYAPDAVRHCRFVKTAREIDLMRKASKANVAAAGETALAMRASGAHDQIRRDFNARAAALGNEPRFLVLNGKVNSGAETELSDGQSILLDAVSHYRGYHGDYGRTVFIGEPPAAMMRRVTAVNTAWAALREELRPGMHYSAIAARGNALLAQMEPGLAVPFNPHAVGLAHTEQPGTDFTGAPLDPVLEAGTILSVDMPIMHDDPEGTAHMEDLRLITDEGSEAIHADDVPYYLS